MKNTHLAVGIASSIAVGAILGILFAPDKGCNTRRKITQKSNGFKNNIKDSVSHLASSVEEKYDQLSSKVENSISDEKSKLGNLKKEIK